MTFFVSRDCHESDRKTRKENTVIKIEIYIRKYLFFVLFVLFQIVYK